MGFYLKRYAARDTAADVAARDAYSIAHETARTEFDKKFPQITAENFAEAAAFQSIRIQELLNATNRDT